MSSATLLIPAGVSGTVLIRYDMESRLSDTVKNTDDIYIRQVLPVKMIWNLESMR